MGSTLINTSRISEGPLVRHEHMENKTEGKTKDNVVTEEGDRITQIKEDAGLVFKQFETLEEDMNRGFQYPKSHSTIHPEYLDQSDDYKAEDHLYQNIEKQTICENVLKFDSEETFYENITVDQDQIYENFPFFEKSSCYDVSNISDNVSVYENVKILRNSVKEVNDIVNQNPEDLSVLAKYKTEKMSKENLRSPSLEKFNIEKSSNRLNDISGGLYYARMINTE